MPQNYLTSTKLQSTSLFRNGMTGRISSLVDLSIYIAMTLFGEIQAPEIAFSHMTSHSAYAILPARVGLDFCLLLRHLGAIATTGMKA